MGLHILVVIDGDLDQAVAAEPRFDRMPPLGGSARVIRVFHFMPGDVLPKVVVNRVENSLAFLAAEGEPFGAELDGAGDASVEAGTRLMVERMHGHGDGDAMLSWQPER